MWGNKYISITGSCLIHPSVDPNLAVLSVLYMSLVLYNCAISSFSPKTLEFLWLKSTFLLQVPETAIFFIEDGRKVPAAWFLYTGIKTKDRLLDSAYYCNPPIPLFPLPISPKKEHSVALVNINICIFSWTIIQLVVCVEAKGRKGSFASILYSQEVFKSSKDAKLRELVSACINCQA